MSRVKAVVRGRMMILVAIMMMRIVVYIVMMRMIRVVWS